MEYIVFNVLCCIVSGSEEPVLSGPSSWKSEFLGTSEFQLVERRETR